MPILISEEVAENKLNHPKNLIVKHSIIGFGNHSTKREGKPIGGGITSPEIKAMLGAIAMTDGVVNTAKTFNLSKTTISNNMNGLDSQGKPNEKLQSALDQNISIVREKVIDRILKHVDAITEDKIEEASLPILAKSASNLASIFDKFRDSNPANITQQQFVFFGVKPREENDYNIIEVEAQVS